MQTQSLSKEQQKALIASKLKELATNDPKKLEEIYKRAQATNTYRVALYTPYSKQHELHKAGKDNNIRAFFAGNRCGKSYAGMMEDTYHLTGLYPDWWEGHRFSKPINMWAASDTSTTTRDILQKGLLGDTDDMGTGTIPKELIDFKSIIKIPNGTGAIDTIRVKHASGGYSRLTFKSYEQGRAKFQGTNQDWIHLDEEPPQDVYTECVTRTANVDGRVLLTMTPLSGMTALMERFIDGVNGRPMANATYITATWEDNPYLPLKMKETLLDQYLPHEIEARTKGIPSIGEGKVYPVLEEGIKFTPKESFPPSYVHMFGMDFGWYDTSVVVGAYDKNTDILYIYDCYKEGAAHGTGRTPAEHMVNMPKVVREVKGVCDPSGGSTSQASGERAIDQYREEGLDIVPANNSVEAGILSVLDRMKSGRLKVADTPNMEKWWKEFRNYARNRTSTGKINYSKNDHIMDAMRYLVFSGVTECSNSSVMTNYYANSYKQADDWILA